MLTTANALPCLDVNIIPFRDVKNQGFREKLYIIKLTLEYKIKIIVKLKQKIEGVSYGTEHGEGTNL